MLIKSGLLLLVIQPGWSIRVWPAIRRPAIVVVKLHRVRLGMKTPGLEQTKHSVASNLFLYVTTNYFHNLWANGGRQRSRGEKNFGTRPRRTFCDFAMDITFEIIISKVCHWLNQAWGLCNLVGIRCGCDYIKWPFRDELSTSEALSRSSTGCVHVRYQVIGHFPM